jgi:branched-chain amino acid transport system permease protein
MLFGSVLASIRTPLSSSAWELGPFWGDFISIFVNKSRGIAALMSIAVMIVLSLLITRSRLGKSLRAAADNPEAAIYMGIDVDRAHRVAFALGIGITAIAGGLLATNYPFQPYIGHEYVIVMYAGVVLGGMGSIIGAFWGGMTIGLVQQLSTLILPTQLQNAAIFVVFLLIVFLRPQGFFGRVAERT